MGYMSDIDLILEIFLVTLEIVIRRFGQLFDSHCDIFHWW